MQVDRAHKRYISWEVIIYALILVLALILRLYQVGARPLQTSESPLAMSSWHMIVGESPLDWEEPLVTGSTSGVFFLFGDNDLTARLLPVILGTALVSLPWFLRGMLGKGGAIVTALVLALSPSFIYFSRSLSASMYVAILSFLLVICVFGHTRSSNSVFASVPLVALLLCSGVMGFGTVTLLALSCAMLFTLREGSNEIVKSFQGAWSERQNLMGYASFSVGLFLSVSTAAFTHPERLGLPSLTAWVKAFDLSRAGEPWYWHLRLMAIYDPLIVALGLIGAVYFLLRWRRDRCQGYGLQMFLIFWAGGSLILLALMGRKEADQIISPLLPLVLLSGSLIAGLSTRIGSRSLLQATSSRRGQRWAVAVIVPLIGLGLIYAIHTGWRLNYGPSTTEWLTSCATSPPVREMVQAVEDTSKDLADPEAKVAVESSVAQPFAWYLRYRESFEYVGRLTKAAPMVVALPDEQTQTELSRYAVRLRGALCTEWFRTPLNFRDFWRWVLYREGWGDQRQVAVALYLRR